MATIIDKINELYDQATTKVAIQVSKKEWLLNNTNNWNDLISITNFNQLRGVSISGGLVDSTNTTTLIENGAVRITANGDYRSLWYGDYENKQTLTINAKNATAPITITMNTNSRGRLPIAYNGTTHFSVTSNNVGGWEPCGHVGIIPNIVNLGDLKLSNNGNVVNGQYCGVYWKSANQTIIFGWSDYPSFPSRVPRNGRTYAYGSYQGTLLETTNFILGDPAPNGNGSCSSGTTGVDWTDNLQDEVWSETPKGL